MTKHFIINIKIPYAPPCGLEYKRTAYVVAAGKRLAIKKFLFYLNGDPKFSQYFRIPIDKPLKHYNEMPDVYTDKLHQFLITVKHIGAHDDMVDISDIVQ
jgi:hypothetical protein